jgi:hypothetical protein
LYRTTPQSMWYNSIKHVSPYFVFVAGPRKNFP